MTGERCSGFTGVSEDNLQQPQIRPCCHGDRGCSTNSALVQQ